jgi:signal transduction histidine kinase
MGSPPHRVLLIERERAFASEASHGLRTPIAVVRGATEVLLDDPRLDPVLRERVLRIERGAAELADLMDALLALARATTPERLRWQASDGSEIVASALASQARLLADAGLSPRLVTGDDVTFEVPIAAFDAAIRNLARGLAAEHVSGTLRAQVGDRSVRLEVEGVEVTAEADAAATLPPDRSVALGLVARLAQRLGWRLTLGSSARGEIVCLQLDLRALTRA